MEGFFEFLIIFVLVVIYSILLLAIYKHFFIDAKDPDAILHFCENKDSVKGNFVLLLPIHEVRKKKTIIVEIQNSIQEEDSQELQSI